MEPYGPKKPREASLMWQVLCFWNGTEYGRVGSAVCTHAGNLSFVRSVLPTACHRSLRGSHENLQRPGFRFAVFAHMQVIVFLGQTAFKVSRPMCCPRPWGMPVDLAATVAVKAFAAGDGRWSTDVGVPKGGGLQVF